MLKDNGDVKSPPMTFLDLCACIGGMSLGLTAAGMTCIHQVEIDPWRRKVLEKNFPGIPKTGDIYDFDPKSARDADLVAGGYPCQPFSLSGKRKGKSDDRHLWPRVFEIVQSIRPSWCLFENVAGHITLGLDAVLADLGGAGYSAWPVVIPACAVEAKHLRERVWILAHTPCNNLQGRPHEAAGGGIEPREEQLAGFLLTGARASVSSAGAYGARYGFSNRLDGSKRNSACGEAIVPQLVYEIGTAIRLAHEQHMRELREVV